MSDSLFIYWHVGFFIHSGMSDSLFIVACWILYYIVVCWILYSYSGMSDSLFIECHVGTLKSYVWSRMRFKIGTFQVRYHISHYWSDRGLKSTIVNAPLFKKISLLKITKMASLGLNCNKIGFAFSNLYFCFIFINHQLLWTKMRTLSRKLE